MDFALPEDQRVRIKESEGLDKYLDLEAKKMTVAVILIIGKRPNGGVANMTDCDIVSEFKLQSCYYIHFRSNTFVKSMKLLILLSAMD